MTGTDTTLLNERTAETLLLALDQLEIKFDKDHGWDMMPSLFVVHELITLPPAMRDIAVERGVGAEELSGFTGGISLAEVPVPSHVWGQFEPVRLLSAMGQEMAADRRTLDVLLGSAARPDLSIDQRTVGFALLCEAWQRRPDSDPRRSIHEHPEERDDELRIITAMDVDYRQYLVIRRRHAGTRSLRMITAEEAERLIDGSDSPQIGWLRKTHPGGQPAIPYALSQMIEAIRGVPR